jgi:biotin transport system substrate-specific component
VLTPLQFFWVAIGVLLTMVGTLIQITIPESAPVLGGYHFSLQMGGVLLTACLGGASAGVYAQIIYLALGLTGQPIFSYGGGLSYLQEPSFGYLLGFIPASWACGLLAFRPKPWDPSFSRTKQFFPSTLKDLGLACYSGLILVHLTGISYLVGRVTWTAELLNLIALYSGYVLPGQFIVTSTTAFLALLARRLLFS